MKTHRRKCPCCNRLFWDFTSTADGHDFDKTWKGTLCNDCACWMEYIKSEKPHMEIIAGTCYDFLPPQYDWGPGDTLGGGHMKYILKKDGSIKKSNDIWKIGEVPQRFRDVLQDTGWWITRRLFLRLRRGMFECGNKGCFDRYHCLRYNVKKEYDGGPYNRIPRNWCVGDEKCPSFCNILEIENYDRLEMP